MKQDVMRRLGRDYTVELWRFFFCIAVLGLHFFSKTEYSFFRAGYLGVEFFFLLSGYGIFSFYVKNMEGKKFLLKLDKFGFYIGSRILRLYPLYLLSLLCMLVLRMFQNSWSLPDVTGYLKRGWAEFLMLQCGPLGNEVLISAHWYVAAFFWGSVILIILLMLTGKAGGFLLCPIISIGIYSYYFQLIRKIDVIFSYHAVLRAVAGLAFGIFIGFCVRAVQTKFGEKARGPLYMLGNVLLAGVFIFTNFGRRSWTDFLVIALYGIALFCLLYAAFPISEKKKVLFKRLSSVTYPVYLFQMPVIELLFWLTGS